LPWIVFFLPPGEKQRNTPLFACGCQQPVEERRALFGPRSKTTEKSEMTPVTADRFGQCCSKAPFHLLAGVPSTRIALPFTFCPTSGRWSWPDGLLLASALLLPFLPSLPPQSILAVGSWEEISRFLLPTGRHFARWFHQSPRKKWPIY